MEKETSYIELWPDEWECLAPHLKGVVTAVPLDHLGEVPPPPPVSITCDDETYEKVLAVAKEHCPKLVRHIERNKHKVKPRT